MESDDAFAAAVTAQHTLESALRDAGLDPAADFPQLCADVAPLGEPRINVGAITLAAAARLAAALAGPEGER